MNAQRILAAALLLGTMIATAPLTLAAGPAAATPASAAPATTVSASPSATGADWPWTAQR